MDRPRQLSRVIDHMLLTWEICATIGEAHIGTVWLLDGGLHYAGEHWQCA